MQSYKAAFGDLTYTVSGCIFESQSRSDAKRKHDRPKAGKEKKMSYPTITRTPHWSVDSVRAACIRNNLYTMGTNSQYSAMLDRVARVDNPSDFGILVAAEDIAAHSEDQTVTNVMYILANEAVFYTFELDGDDNA